MKKSLQKGYSLTEIIVSLAIIVLLSTAAFSSIVVGMRMQANAEADRRIVSAGECFQTSFENSDNEADFENRVQFALGVMPDGEGNYVYTENGITVTCVYNNGEITVVGKRDDSDKIIYSYSSAE